MEINASGLTVRAPLHASEAEIKAFLEAHRGWIEAHMQRWQQRQAQLAELPPLTTAELRDLAAQAREVIAARVAYYAPQVGVTYGKITIRTQRSRWGSCSANGNLSFNCLLMLAPPEVLDSVVVHELCHRKQMNHSAAFYAQVLRVFPEYRKWNAWLRENGPLLLLRATE